MFLALCTFNTTFPDIKHLKVLKLVLPWIKTQQLKQRTSKNLNYDARLVIQAVWSHLSNFINAEPNNKDQKDVSEEDKRMLGEKQKHETCWSVNSFKKNKSSHLRGAQNQSRRTPRPGNETRRCGRRICLQRCPEEKTNNNIVSHIHEKSDS